jgi:hypothetical protein
VAQSVQRTINSPERHIDSRILFVRSQKVMLDADLAALYGISTKSLFQSIRRNLKRFPPDFMFSLSEQEVADLRSQIVTSNVLPLAQ